MKATRNGLVMLAGVLTTLVSTGCGAATVAWSFNATFMERLYGNAAVLDEMGLLLGSTVSGTFLVDDTVPGTNISGNTWFFDTNIDISLSMGRLQSRYTEGFGLFNALTIRDGTTDDIVSNSLEVLHTDPEYGEFTSLVSFQLFDATGAMLDGNSFPTLPPFASVAPYNGTGIESSFFLVSGRVAGEFFTMSARYDAFSARVVPVPGAFLLFASALLVPLLRRLPFA